MADIEKTIKDLDEQIAWIQDNDFHKFPGWGHAVLAMKDALELLKGYKKIKEQLEELQIMEDLKVKECESYCEWEIYQYHRGRFDAYSIALAGFEQKDGDGK